MSPLRPLLAAFLFGVVCTTGIFASASATRALSISQEYSDIRSQGLIFANLCDAPFDTDSTCDCKEYGECSLEQVLQMVVNVSYLVLALSGSAALIAFVYGGFEWILSAGYAERVDRGKKAIVGAAIGLAIVFGAYTFINLVISILVEGAPATAPIEDTIGSGASDIIKTE